MDYEVNYDTQVILPIEGSKSKVIESDNEYVVNQTVQEVLNTVVNILVVHTKVEKKALEKC